MTKQPAPPSVPSSFVSSTLHSSCTLLSFTRGGFTRLEGAGVKPALMNSLVPFGYSQLASDICCTMS